MKFWKKNLFLLTLVLLLTVIPLVFISGEYAGADGQAEEVIGEIDSDYEPWIEPIFEPASGEIESLLFVLQAAIGAAIIGFGFGRMSAKAKVSEQADGNR